MKKHVLIMAFAMVTLGHATAQTADYVVDDIYPGMPAAKAKSAGFSNCQSNGSDEVICRRNNPTKEILGIPVQSVIAIFESPYTTVKEVQVKFITTKRDKSCKPGKGAWGEVITAECFHNVPAAITKAFGPPVNERYGETWHRCGQYAMTYESQASLLHVIDTPENIDIRKYECEQAKKRRAEQEASAKGSNDFIKRMK